MLDFGNSDELQVGDVVLAIGNPFGVGQTVTHGIVSAVARTQVGISDYQFFIQTDAAINPGNSGGALVDMAGRLVGINTAIFSRSGGSQGIGFAIPANMVRVVVASAKAGGSAVKRPWLGAKLQELTPELAENSTSSGRAARWSQRHRGRPGGARRPEAWRRHRRRRRPGGRRSQRVQLPLRHACRSAAASRSASCAAAARAKSDRAAKPRPKRRATKSLSRRARRSSVPVANLSPALADELRLDAASEGGGGARGRRRHARPKLGFQRGDIVVSVNNQKIVKTSDLERIAKARQRAGCGA